MSKKINLPSSRPPITSINRYIERVISDAMDTIVFQGEHPMRPSYWTMMIGDDLLVDIEPLYVNYRGNSYLVNKIVYRLAHNLEKNFGVHPYFPGEAALVSRASWELDSPYDLQQPTGGYSYVHTLAELEIFGEKRFLVTPNNYIWGMDLSTDEENVILDKLEEHGFNSCNLPPFEVYDDILKKIFGHTAQELWEHQLSHNHSIRGIVDWLP